MVFENIRVEHENFTINVVDGTSFFTIDHVTNQLIEKGSGGNVIFTYFLDTDIINEVVSLEHDGIHFWSLEKSGAAGFIIRKWLIGSDNLVRVQTTFSFSSDIRNNYGVHTLAVEWYQDAMVSNTPAGTTSFDVTDGSVIQAGDRLVVGPSTSSGFEGFTADTVVLNVVGSTVTVSPLLGIPFNSADPMYFTRSLFVFSDQAPFNTEIGSLYKFDPFTAVVLAINTSNLFNGVRAATFFKNKVMFVKAGEIIWLNPLSQSIFKSQAIDNLELNRADHYNAFDLTGFSNTIYRLEDRKITLSAGVYSKETWSEFNYNTSSAVPEVYFLAVKAEPPLIHHAVAGLTPESIITVQVLDQFRTPVFNRLVQLTSTGGGLNPTQDTTDADGIITSTYTASTAVGQVEIEASVT